MKYFAHRGITNNEMENSRQAILNTFMSSKYAGVEIDLRMTSDKNVVLCHDTNTRRLSKKTYNINNTPYNIIKNIKLYKSGKILSLRQFFNIYKKYKNRYVIFDVKDNTKYIINKILYFMNKYKIKKNKIIIIVWDKSISLDNLENINLYYAIDGNRITKQEIQIIINKKYKGIGLKFDNSNNNIKSINLIKNFKLKVGLYIPSKDNLNNAKKIKNINCITY